MSVQGGDLRVGEREGDKEFSKETQAASFFGMVILGREDLVKQLKLFFKHVFSFYI